MPKIDLDYYKRITRDIVDGLEEIEDTVKLSIDEFIHNKSKRYAMRYAVILVVEAAADLGVAILRQYFDEEPESYREVFLKLAEKGVIKYATARGMALLASLRNMIVHRYWRIDDARIYVEAKNNGIETIKNFLKEVNDYVSKDP